MTYFLDTLSQEVLKQHGHRLESITMVFPSRRAGLYFQQHLVRKAGKVIVLPEVLTMGGLMERLAGLSIIDDLDQLFALYQVHMEIEEKESRSFDEMMGWGQTLLSDFNDVDQYMVDASSVFTYLDEAKAIALWNPAEPTLTEVQQHYLDFFGSLIKYYHQLKAHLESRGCGYAGMVYRRAAEQVTDSNKEAASASHYIFAGFNALSKSEEVVIETLIQQGIASTYWDADSYYIRDNNQEAGQYLRDKLRPTGLFGESWINDNLTTQPKEIDVIGAGLSTAQAVAVSGILATMDAEHLADTAVVINDDKTLFPLLNAIPAHISDFNLSMGLSLRFTPAAELIADYFNLHSRYRKNQESNQLYLQSATRLLQHPWLQAVMSDAGFDTAYAGSKWSSWKKTQRILIDPEELRQQVGEENWSKVGVLFNPWEDAEEGLGYLATYIARTEAYYRKLTTKHPIEVGVLPLLHDILKRISSQLPDKAIKQKRNLKSLILKLLQRQSIRFSGEPLKGLQIMGMLETRLLDFETLIITGMNEGLMPKPSGQSSFIPFDVKHYFGLPMPKDKEVVFAYHYYRLLQRARKIYLLYNTEGDGFGSGEKSRYIQQTIRELPKVNPNCIIREYFATLPPLPEAQKPAPICKDEQVMKRLMEIAESGYSASHLMTYMRCQVKFFYQYIIGIEANQDPEGTMDSSTLGIALHDALMKIYSDSIGADAIPHLKASLDKISGIMEESMKKSVAEETLQQGENYLLKEVAITQLQHFIRSELERNEQGQGFREIIGVEKRLDSNLVVDGVEIHLKGIIDRIDKDAEGIIRIIDYKSGQVLSPELKVDPEELTNDQGRKSKAFQLMFYTWLSFRQFPEYGARRAGIFSFRNMSEGLIPLLLAKNRNLTLHDMQDFEESLKELLSVILNPAINLVHTENTNDCIRCDFRNLCGLI